MGSYHPCRPSRAGWGGVIRSISEIPKVGRRGQPLIVLALVLIGWVAFRVAIVNSAGGDDPVTGSCEQPLCRSSAFEVGAKSASAQPSPGLANITELAQDRPVQLVADPSRTSKVNAAQVTAVQGTMGRKLLTIGGQQTLHIPPRSLSIPPRSRRKFGAKSEGARAAPAPWPLSVEHPEVEVADSFVPLTSHQAAPGRKAASSFRIPSNPQEPSGQQRARWTADGWLLLRPSGGQAALATLPAAYGSSQFGAVIRYDLRPESAVRSQVYLRATGAIGAAFRDRQAALGLAIRPFRKLPIAALIEGRLQQGSETLRIRPAVALLSDIAPFRLPLDAVGEAYGQVGYVGGRNPTGFFDAQVTAERSVLKLGSASALGIGAGIWTGGQRGAARLDIGPRAVLRTSLSALPVRVTLDWRERIAGGASPGSGPVLTLAAGF